MVLVAEVHPQVRPVLEPLSTVGMVAGCVPKLVFPRLEVALLLAVHQLYVADQFWMCGRFEVARTTGGQFGDVLINLFEFIWPGHPR